ncbi:MAG: hypothetical protein AVDCRST_MAG57-3506 [uncultured Blastococcus sp.]|uniref:Uncharacterized protein n=1 Tax=uncultured Blastococcus sp. TaxID=217144 RepID=A0A6J4JHV0_9ACTN|nr:MAG: hypothetical protein AVDCRST_MAG57-3506 [uncultured Blastococcus sp.]
MIRKPSSVDPSVQTVPIQSWKKIIAGLPQCRPARVDAMSRRSLATTTATSPTDRP